jgi:anthranilate synthase component II
LSVPPAAPGTAPLHRQTEFAGEPPKVLVLDNYDSFTYNLVQLLEVLGARTEVRRNDAISVPEVMAQGYDRIVISPGPGIPLRAGITVPLIREAAARTRLLGVCLGLQAIGEAFGGRVVRAPVIFHGKTSLVLHDGRGLFRGVPSPFTAMRYHSLILERESLPSCLEVSAWTGDGVVMGIRHRTLPLEGVQFHPESILTVEGAKLLANFLEEASRRKEVRGAIPAAEPIPPREAGPEARGSRG